MLQHVRILALALLLVATGCTKKNAADDAKDASNEETAAQEDRAGDEEEDADAEAEKADDEDLERETQRWFVFDEKVPCGQDDSTDCFRIRRASNPEWEVIQGDIKGFDYEEGTRYILEVAVLTKVDAPEDAEASDESDDDANAEAQAAEDADAAPARTEVGYELERQVSPPPPGEEEETCTSNEDCEDGEMCTGPAGCDIPWTCEKARPCTRDLRQYCSCEGETIQGSGSCPPAPYKHPGACKD